MNKSRCIENYQKAHIYFKKNNQKIYLRSNILIFKLFLIKNSQILTDFADFCINENLSFLFA